MSNVTTQSILLHYLCAMQDKIIISGMGSISALGSDAMKFGITIKVKPPELQTVVLTTLILPWENFIQKRKYLLKNFVKKTHTLNV